MSTTTQCPECGTRFKASPEQLEAYHGMVRCGHCHAAFNAIEHQCSDEPSPQLDLPMELEEFIPSPAIEQVIHENEDRHAGRERKQELHENKIEAELQERKRNWPLGVASLTLCTLLMGQALYFFRVDLAARLPGLKPALNAYCSLLKCTVPLPHNADLVSIESSSLEADPMRANIVVLTATLSNHASYAQALPELELTLNDINDRPVARRTFHPAEYLINGYDENLGLAGNREMNVKINLDVTDLKAAGYRLLLTYPQ